MVGSFLATLYYCYFKAVQINVMGQQGFHVQMYQVKGLVVYAYYDGV